MQRWLYAALALVIGCGLVHGEVTTRPATTQAGAKKLPFTVSKETTRVVSPLREDGTPDYLAALNEKHGKDVKPEENGWVVWAKLIGSGRIPAESREKALKLAGAQGVTEQGMGWEDYLSWVKPKDFDDQAQRELLRDACTRVWKASEKPLLVEYIKVQEKQFSMLIDAVNRPKWYAPYGGSIAPGIAKFGMPLSSIQGAGMFPLRSAVDGLTARAMLRVGEGDFKGAIEDLSTVKRIARISAKGATTWELLIGYAEETRANLALGAMLGTGTLTAEQCRQVDALIARQEEISNLDQIWDHFERWQALQFVMIFARSANLKDANPGRLWQVEKDEVDWDAVLKLVNDVFDYVAEIRKDPSKAGQKKIDLTAIARGAENGFFWKNANESKEAYSQRVGQALCTWCVPALSAIERLRNKTLLEQEMVRALAAAAEVRAKTGKWPEKLAELVPSSLKAVPKDILSKEGKELGYKTGERGAVVTSVGLRSNEPIEVGVK